MTESLATSLYGTETVGENESTLIEFDPHPSLLAVTVRFQQVIIDSMIVNLDAFQSWLKIICVHESLV